MAHTMREQGERKNVISDHTYGTWRAQSAWKEPPFIARAEGIYFYDDEGKAYIDFSSQLMCSNLGHNNLEVINAIVEQAQKLPYVAPGFSCEMKVAATQALVDILPSALNRMFFSTSGTEANEAAVRLILSYMQPKGKYKLISRYRSYHGSTAASIALTGDPRRWFAEPNGKLGNVVFAPDAYCYRCPFGLSYPDCQVQCAEYVDYMIKEEGNVAAIIIEPIVGTNGIIVPPPEYLPRLRQIADANDVLLVADEVMTGWFRTGKLLAVEHWDVMPDVVTMAKGCTAAYTPVGITLTSEKIKNHFEERFFPYGHTYAMHPLTLSAIPAAIGEYKKLMASGLPQTVSQHLGERLRGLKEEHACIGDVRGLGHFWAIELVKNRRTREPFNTKADKAALKPLAISALASEMLRKGVYVAAWYNHFIIAPPLIITNEEVDHGIAVIHEVLKMADTEVTD